MHEGIVSLSDGDLLARMPALVGGERKAMAEVIAHLMEIDRRRLYLGQACSSLFAFCRERLCYSEDEALKRVRVARLSLDVPEALDELRSGGIHLTGLFVLSRYVTRENAGALFAEARGKSRRELERLLAKHYPRSDVADRIAPVGRLEPLSASRFRVEFTVSRELCEKIERARDLLSHVLPDGDLASLFERAIDELLRREMQRRFGSGRSRKRRELMVDSRHVPVEVVRAVWERDGAQCAFVDASGRRCSERRFLTLEHRVPYACGGEPTVENLCLLCAGHNGYTAREVFGDEYIARKRSERALSSPALSSSPLSSRK